MDKSSMHRKLFNTISETLKEIEEFNKWHKEQEELQKNMNMSYGGAPQNMSTGAATGALERQESPEKVDKDMKAVAEKAEANLNNPYNEQPAGKKGENARNDKNNKEPELKAPEVGGAKREQPSVKKDEGKEYLNLFKNGQWSLEKKKKRMPKGPAHKPEPNITPSDIKALETEHPSQLSEKDAMKLVKDEMCKDAANPKLAPKDVKVKELQTKIDAGTYKPDAGKIADKMLQPKK